MMTDNDLLKLNRFAENAPELMLAYAYDAYALMTSLHTDADGSSPVQQSASMDNAGPSSCSSPDDTTTWYTYDDVRYYGYRYYSPSLGRWLARDPIDEGGSVLSRNSGRYVYLLFLQSREPEIISQDNIVSCLSCASSSVAELSNGNSDENETPKYQTWGPNLYAFVGNNTVNITDPTGLGIITYAYCAYKLHQWQQRCHTGLPDCSKICDPWKQAECYVFRTRLIAQCMAAAATMFETCLKVMMP